MAFKHLLADSELTQNLIEEIFYETTVLKTDCKKGIFSMALSGRTLGMIFEKPSMRTRVSFEVGMTQLGGHAIFLGPESFTFGKREAIKDIARVMARYVDGIMIRTFAQKNVTELAKYSDVPVINGLSDYWHPCQALADIYTAIEKFGDVKGRKLTFVGDGNNVARSLAWVATTLGMHFAIATPKGYEFDKAFVQKLCASSARKKIFTQHNNAADAIKNADVVYTDTWTSMGQEAEAAERKKKFMDFQINGNVLKRAKKTAIVMHCLPAHRGEELTDQVIDGKQSAVYDEAENRLHVQKAVMKMLMAK